MSQKAKRAIHSRATNISATDAVSRMIGKSAMRARLALHRRPLQPRTTTARPSRHAPTSALTYGSSQTMPKRARTASRTDAIRMIARPVAISRGTLRRPNRSALHESSKLRDHPWYHVGLKHCEQPHQGREDEAVHDHLGENLAFATFRVYSRGAHRQVLRTDHLSHDAR